MANCQTSEVARRGGSVVRAHDSIWRLVRSESNSCTWEGTPAILDRLLGDLFTAQPGDVLDWLHNAVWRIRQEELKNALLQVNRVRRSTNYDTLDGGFMQSLLSMRSSQSSVSVDRVASLASMVSSVKESVKDDDSIPEEKHSFLEPELERSEYTPRVLAGLNRASCSPFLDAVGVNEPFAKESCESGNNKCDTDPVQFEQCDDISCKGSAQGVSKVWQMPDLVRGLNHDLRPQAIEAEFDHAPSQIDLTGVRCAFDVEGPPETSHRDSISSNTSRPSVTSSIGRKADRNLNSMNTQAPLDIQEDASWTLGWEKHRNLKGKKRRQSLNSQGSMTSNFSKISGSCSASPWVMSFVSMSSERVGIRRHSCFLIKNMDGTLQVQVDASRSRSPFLLLPNGLTSLMLDIIFFSFLMFEIWSTSFKLAFLQGLAGMPQRIEMLNQISCVFFLVDTLLAFFRGFYSGEFVVNNSLRKAALRHLFTWFGIDLSATLPYLVIDMLYQQDVPSILQNVAVACRLIRILRLGRGWLCAECIVRHSPIPSALRLLFELLWILVLTLLFVHVLAVARQLVSDKTFTSANAAAEWYFECFQWGYMMFTLVNFDGAAHHAVHLSRRHQVLQVSVTAFLCTAILAVILRMNHRSMATWNMSSVAQAENTANVLVSLRQNRVPVHLQKEILWHMRMKKLSLEKQRQFELYREAIPQYMQVEVLAGIWVPRLLTMMLMRWLTDLCEGFIFDLAMEVHVNTFAPYELVFSTGQESDSSFFIIEGIVFVQVGDETGSDFLTGMWIGEKALVNPELCRRETAVCKVSTEFMVVQSADFRELLRYHKLQDKFDFLLRKTLWMGLCGRCGSLGDHSSENCPYADLEKDRAIRRVSSLGSRASGSMSSVTAIMEDLPDLMAEVGRFLRDHDMERLKPHLLEMGLGSLDDFDQAIVQALKERPEVALTPNEESILLGSTMAQYKRRIHMANKVILSNLDESSSVLFISHYKVEAGTEAALLQKDFERLLLQEGIWQGKGTAVFVDSENLSDLSELKAHVQKSQNLVLLLTNKVLTRPWVLVELVTAVASNILVIPVEIDRKGAGFDYPDEAYYTRVLERCELSESAMQVLESESIELHEVVDALRAVFRRISLTFSPHKSNKIREAELRNILDHCRIIQHHKSNKSTGFRHQRSEARMKLKASVKNIRSG